MSHLPQFLSDAVDQVAKPIGIPQDQARMILSILAAIPLGEIHKRLPSTFIKHFYSFVTGFFIGWFVVGNGALHVLAASMLVYVLARILPSHSMPYIITMLLVLYLSIFHIWRLYTSYLSWEMDVTLIQMIFVVKASTFAFNWSDGQKLLANEQLHPKPHLHEHFKSRALMKFPSIIEYLSYIWSFAGLLAGPCFECKEYLDFTNGTMFKSLGLKSPPSTLVPSLISIGKAVLCYPFVAIHGMFPIIGFVNTPAFYELSFIHRFWYFWLTMTCSRFKYYFAWYLSEAGMNAEGFGLSGKNPKTGELEWERGSNVDAIKVETSTSMPAITNSWNIGVNNWLKYYIYLRINPPRSISKIIPTKSLANLITKLCSAFWHGFYPAYYLFFIGAYVANEMDETLRTHVLIRINPNNKIGILLYKIISWILIFFEMNSLGMAFMLLEIKSSINFWKSLHFSVFWIPVLVIIGCKIFFPVKASKRELKEKADKIDEASKGNGKQSNGKNEEVKKEL